MQKIRTLIVDDEPLARHRIKNLLLQKDYVQVIGECKNGREAKQSIKNFVPDLVFMDIEMPDFSGVDIVEQDNSSERPFFVFVTAHDEHALKAFALRAVDYLLKPYDEDRFFYALEHAKKRIGEKKDAQLHNQMIKLLQKHQVETEATANLVEINHRGRRFNIKTTDINYIEADGNYLRLHVEGAKYLIRQTMQSMQGMLNEHLFLRIHRSLIVNKDFVQETRYEGNNQFAFTMKCGKVLLSGRSFKEAVKKYLGEES